MIHDLDDLYPKQQIDSQFLAKYQKQRKIDALSKPQPRLQPKVDVNNGAKRKKYPSQQSPSPESPSQAKQHKHPLRTPGPKVGPKSIPTQALEPADASLEESPQERMGLSIWIWLLIAWGVVQLIRLIDRL